jgi:putative membrane protein
MARERSLLDKFFLFIKGLSMGAANKVPGVSGGTVSFVLGFYEEMIYSFRKINYKAFLLLINGRFKSFYAYTNATFLILVFGGSMFSYFSVSLVLDYLLQYYELYVWSSFFGLILGSIYYISKDFNDWRINNIISIIIGIGLGVAISFMNPAKENDNLWFVFACGIIGVSGMTLPGLSGSFILILLGNYVLLLVDSVTMMYKTFAEVFIGDFSFMDNEERIRYLKIIASFTGGSAFGLVFTSHILAYVLKRWHQIVTAVIIGFITGSLGIVWPWKKEIYKIENGKTLIDVNGDKVIENFKRYFPDFSLQETWIAILFILVGLGIILLIDKYGTERKEYIDE